jgi:cell pole-organizing protein PopZ
MNAIPAPQGASTSPVSKSSDPSMEEILASIRRIIADDQVLPLTPRPVRPTLVEANPPKAEPTGEADAARARAALTVEPPAQPVPAWMEDKPESALRPSLVEAAFVAPKFPPPRETIVEPPRSEPPRARPPVEARPVEARPVQTRSVERRVPEPPAVEPRAVETRSVEQRKTAEAPSALLSASANASIASSFQSLAQTMLFKDKGVIEDMARDMLRPMLKQWLDDNLPTMVERLVRAEIERVARGGR